MTLSRSQGKSEAKPGLEPGFLLPTERQHHTECKYRFWGGRDLTLRDFLQPRGGSGTPSVPGAFPASPLAGLTLASASSAKRDRRFPSYPGAHTTPSPPTGQGVRLEPWARNKGTLSPL